MAKKTEFDKFAAQLRKRLKDGFVVTIETEGEQGKQIAVVVTNPAKSSTLSVRVTAPLPWSVESTVNTANNIFS